MKDRLPEHIEPLRLASTGRLLGGVLPLSRMTRLVDTVAAVSGDAEVEMNFSVNLSDMACLKGHIHAEVGLQCQRCMQTMTWPIDNEFELLIVESDAEAELIGDDNEVLLLNEQLVSVSELIEDEILLCLPIVPMHPSGSDCANKAIAESEAAEKLAEQAVKAEAVEEIEDEEAKENPFAVLAELKNRKD